MAGMKRVWRRALRALVCAVMAYGLSGCATSWLHGTAGPAVGTSGALGAAVDVGYGQGAFGFGPDVHLRAKLTDRVQSGALGLGGFLAGGGALGAPFVWLNAGVHVLQVDVVEGSAGFGMGSPYLSGGTGWILGDGAQTERTVITAGVHAEYDVRFGRDNEGFFALTLGFGRHHQDRPF